MKYRYVVPALHEKGGIQQFSMSIYNALRTENRIILEDWRNPIHIWERLILRAVPANAAAKRYLRRAKVEHGDFDFTHFWHIEASVGYEAQYVVSVHGMEILEKNVRRYRRILYGQALRNAGFVHANSAYTAKVIADNFDIDSANMRVINPPLSLKISKKGHKNEIPVIGTISRFVKRKNISGIIKALRILHESGVDFTYKLAGTGPLKGNILKELKRSPFRWEYLGEISEKDKIDGFYPSLDVFVLPPLELKDDVEGFGMVYLEANAYGIPVVAARTGGVPDAVKEGVSGVFANPESPEDIAKKAKYLLKNHRKYEETAKSWAENFLPEKIAPKFEEMYEELLR